MLKKTLTWLSEPCDWYQIGITIMLAAGLCVLMEVKHVYWGFIVLTLLVSLSLSIGMIATKLEVRWLQWLVLPVFIVSFIWLCVWLYSVY